MNQKLFTDIFLNYVILNKVSKKYIIMVIKTPIIQKSVQIQKLNRVTLNEELLENLNLRQGDKVNIFLDTQKEEIIIRREKNEK